MHNPQELSVPQPQPNPEISCPPEKKRKYPEKNNDHLSKAEAEIEAELGYTLKWATLD